MRDEPNVELKGPNFVNLDTTKGVGPYRQQDAVKKPESRKQSGFADANGKEFDPQDRANARGIWHVKRSQA